MIHTKNCRGCIWFDRCAQEEPCEYYSPVDDSELYEATSMEYRADLDSRHNICAEQIEEQNY